MNYGWVGTTECDFCSHFGARRGSNWQGTHTAADYTAFGNTTRNGFTGHEMLDAVNIVHMSGRVYDPYLGRFLSVGR